MLEDLGKLVDEQYKILEETDLKIIENVVEFHQKKCANPTPVCEEKFLHAFMIVFRTKIHAATLSRNMTEAHSNTKTHLSVVNPQKK